MAQRSVIRLDSGPSAGRTVTRRDTYRLDKSERLQDGSLRVDALVTRVGVFTYHDAQGREIREYRPPEEVQKQDSIRTLSDRAVTVLHPPVLVDPSNWKNYSVGHVSGEPIKDGGGVRVGLVISDQQAIDLIESKRVQEISCGYQVTVKDEQGTTPTGEHYDAIQTDIRYNHVAMGPQGWGRQGSSVSLRLDSAGNQVLEQGDNPMKVTIFYKGQTYVVDSGSKEHNDLLARMAREDQEAKVQLDAATGLQKRLDETTAERDVLTKKNKELQDKLDSAPAAAMQAAKTRVELETKARTILGDSFACEIKDKDGKTVPVPDKDIRVAMIQKYDPEFKADGLSEDYIRAACDTHTRRGSGEVQERMVFDQANPPSGRTDSRGKNEKDPLDPNDPDPELARENARKAKHDHRFSVSHLPQASAK